MHLLIILKKAWENREPDEYRMIIALMLVVVLSGLASSMLVICMYDFFSVLSGSKPVSDTQTITLLSILFHKPAFLQSEATLTIVLVAAICCSTLFQVLRTHFSAKYLSFKSHALSTRLLDVQLRKPYSRLKEQKKGNLKAHVLVEAERAVHMFYFPFTDSISALVMIVLILSSLMIIDPMATIFASVSISISYLLIVSQLSPLIKRLGAIRQRQNEQRFAVLESIADNIKLIKFYGSESHFQNQFSNASAEMFDAQRKAVSLGEMPQYLLQSFAYLAIVVVCVMAMSIPVTTNNQTGDVKEVFTLIIAFAVAAQRLLPEFGRVYRGFLQVKMSEATLNELISSMRPELPKSTISDADNSFDSIRSNYAIEFDNVSFYHKGSDKPTLSSINFKVKSGGRLGIYGASGSGKTTIGDLILGLLHPDQGSVYIDGHDTRFIPATQLNKRMSVVTQQVTLFDGTLLENLTSGLPYSSRDEARALQSLKIAQLESLLETRLTLTSRIGDGNEQLSGGQIQRVGIARALYRLPSIIVLDEATSALDPNTEQKILSGIREFLPDCTIIMITHRKENLVDFDSILVLSDHDQSRVGSYGEVIDRHFKPAA